MENKVTTTDALLNIQRAMSDETFAKQFNFLFSKYIDIKNKDKNAFYHKLLQHLTSAGLTKEEATDFLKDIRVKNADLIQKIEETQQKIKESTEKFEKARFDLLTNPVSAKNYLVLFMETIREINLTLQNIENKHLLNVINKEHFKDKIDEIKKLLEHSEQSINEKLKQDKESGIDDVMLLQETKVTFNKVSEKLNELTAELAINKTLTQNLNIDKDVEKEGHEGKEKTKNPQPEAETESMKDAYMLSDAIYKAELELNTPNDRFNEPDYKEKLAYLSLLIHAMDKHHISDDIWTGIYSRNFDVDFLKKNAELTIQTYNLHDAFNKINNDIKRNTDDILIEDNAAPTESTQNMTLEQALENSLHATLNSVNTELDEKTLSFLTLSEYLHAYNNYPLNEVFEKFKDVFSKDEFKAIVLYNTALIDNATDDVFDFSIEEGFEAVNIKEYAKMLKHNFKQYEELDKELEKELTLDKKEKELEIGVPQRNKKFKGLEIG